jgi:hypothetical protein
VLGSEVTSVEFRGLRCWGQRSPVLGSKIASIEGERSLMLVKSEVTGVEDKRSLIFVRSEVTGVGGKRA